MFRVNIFYLDENPVVAAQYHCDVHCNKQFLENCQMLTNCFAAAHIQDAPRTQKGTVRKRSHYNHPCSKWVRESSQHMDWLIKQTAELSNQRILRGMKPHYTQAFFEWVQNNLFRANLPDNGFEHPPMAINVMSWCRILVPKFEELPRVEQYRLYYNHDKTFATFKNGEPYWYKNESEINK